MVLLTCSYIADLLLGDPESFPHPVRAMGRLITFLDERLNQNDSPRRKRIKGMLSALLVIITSGYLAYLFVAFAGKLNPFLGWLAWIYVGYTVISVKDLSVKARAIAGELTLGSLKEARAKLSCIVGRDTKDLSGDKIIRATVESIAESTTDGIVAPLFYLALGGPALAIVYKAINTLDSMIGYKNERYINFGWFAAKLDDAVNFLPARVSGVLIVVSSFILRKNFTASFKTMLKDSHSHLSPNSGIPEAAMAGALGIQLGGNSAYKGVILRKPRLGKDRSSVKISLINKALAISFTVSFLMILTGGFIKWII